ncbi:MAG: GumC family protein [Cyclobacteriaceae bacterium]|jgi:tyrosine-protein kinase Etk/Wzc
MKYVSPAASQPTDQLDWNKLSSIFRHQRWRILAFMAVSLLSAYLYIRYTKDLYEAESELKLDVKRDATELGIKEFVEDQNINVISGEIEQIKSKLFIGRVLDSLDLDISYLSVGNVLNNELYRRSPFRVEYQFSHRHFLDVPFLLTVEDREHFELRVGEDGKRLEGVFGKPLELDGGTVTILGTQEFNQQNYSFIINSRERLTEYIKRQISVEPLNINANTIRITFQDHNALKAATIVNKIDSVYILYSNEQKNLANKQKIDWLNNELTQVEDKMEAYENYFESFTLQNKSNDLNADLKRVIAQINRLDSQRFDITRRISELDLLQQDLTSGSMTLSPLQRALLPDYTEKKLEELEKMVRDQERIGLAYNENTLAYKQKQQEFNQLRDNVISQVSELKKTYRNQLADLAQRKVKLENAFAAMPDKNTQFSKNQRYYKLYEEFYLTMMQAKAEFEIAQAGSTPDFKILSSAVVPIQPISPRRWMIMGIGLVAGLVLNFFFIGLVYVFNNRINSLREIEQTTDVPVLGTIPVSKKIRKGELHVMSNPKSMISEAIRSLRTNLDFFSTGRDRKLITISSSISGEGKSFLAMNLGAVLAMSHKRVALLDLDMRKSKADQSLKSEDPAKGISTILIRKFKWQDCLVKTALPNLDFIPSGPHPPNPSELLLNGEFSTLLEELKEQYDYIVMDTPPIGLVTDGMMAMRRSDVSIFVFRANYSQREFIHNLQRTVSINKLEHVSVVLNAVPLEQKNYGYGYYEDQEATRTGWRKWFRI